MQVSRYRLSCTGTRADRGRCKYCASVDEGEMLKWNKK